MAAMIAVTSAASASTSSGAAGRLAVGFIISTAVAHPVCLDEILGDTTAGSAGRMGLAVAHESDDCALQRWLDAEASAALLRHWLPDSVGSTRVMVMACRISWVMSGTLRSPAPGGEERRVAAGVAAADHERNVAGTRPAGNCDVLVAGLHLWVGFHPLGGMEPGDIAGCFHLAAALHRGIAPGGVAEQVLLHLRIGSSRLQPILRACSGANTTSDRPELSEPSADMVSAKVPSRPSGSGDW